MKRDIKIAIVQRVEKWTLDEFRDYVLRHGDYTNRDDLLQEYPNHIRLLGALIEVTIEDPSQWHKPLQFFKRFKDKCNEDLNDANVKYENFGQPYKYVLGEPGSPLILADKHLPLVVALMDEGLPYSYEIVEDLFIKQAQRLLYQSTSHMLFTYFMDRLSVHAFKDWWKRKDIKEFMNNKTYSPTAKAMFQASYPNIEIGTSTMDEYFNESDASIWGNIQNVRRLRNALRVRILISHCQLLPNPSKYVSKIPKNAEADKILLSVLVRPIDDYSPRHLYLMQKHVNEYWIHMPASEPPPPPPPSPASVPQSPPVYDHKKIAEELGIALPTGMAERLAPQLAALEEEIEEEIEEQMSKEEMVNDLKKELSDAKALLENRQRQGLEEPLLDTIKEHIQFLTEKLEKTKSELEQEIPPERSWNPEFIRGLSSSTKTWSTTAQHGHES